MITDRQLLSDGRTRSHEHLTLRDLSPEGSVTHLALRSLLRVADDHGVTHSIEDRLHQALWAFHAAVQLRDGIEGRIRRGGLDADLYDRSLQAAELVLSTRLALYRLLIEDGWTPPATVARDLAFDDLLLHQQADHLR